MSSWLFWLYSTDYILLEWIIFKMLCLRWHNLSDSQKLHCLVLPFAMLWILIREIICRNTIWLETRKLNYIQSNELITNTSELQHVSVWFTAVQTAKIVNLFTDTNNLMMALCICYKPRRIYITYNVSKTCQTKLKFILYYIDCYNNSI